MKKAFFCLLIFSLLTISELFAQEDFPVDTDLTEKEESFEEIPFLDPIQIEENSSMDSIKACLVIDCDLRSAQVYLNGIYQGKTKLTIKDLLPADYILEVKKTGYDAKKYYISARSAFTSTYKIKLK